MRYLLNSACKQDSQTGRFPLVFLSCWLYLETVQGHCIASACSLYITSDNYHRTGEHNSSTVLLPAEERFELIIMPYGLMTA